MSSRIAALILLCFLAACGGKSPPRNLNNACSIVDQRPSYLRAFKATERKWGVPVYVQMAVIYQESKFDGDARTPHRYALGVIPMGRQSSAFGYAQALDGTWDDYKRAAGRPGASRKNIKDATDFMGWYMNRTEQRFGIPKTNVRDHYLAYHDGHGGYARGSYRSKSWLINVANGLQTRSETYKRQLQACGKI